MKNKKEIVVPILIVLVVWGGLELYNKNTEVKIWQKLYNNKEVFEEKLNSITETYSDPYFGYQLELPIDWTIEENASEQIILSTSGPGSNTALIVYGSKNYIDGINNINTKDAVVEATDLLIEEMRSNPDAQFLDVQEVEVDDRLAYWLEYEIDLGDIDVISQTYVYINEKDLFQANFITEKSAYNSEKPMTNEIIKSWRFI